MFGCDLLTPRRKLLVTNSAILSSKIIERETHLGLEGHSVRSLALFLHQHPAAGGNRRTLRALSDEERELIGEETALFLSKDNYFKKAFELPGLRHKVFNCIEELRLSGYEVTDFKKTKIQNEKKWLGLEEVFLLYTKALEKLEVYDYALALRQLIQELPTASYTNLLSKFDLILPFDLDLKGMETTLFAVLEERMKVYRPKDAAKGYLADTDPASKGLAVFKDTLVSYLKKESLSSKKGALDSSLSLRATLIPTETIQSTFDWAMEVGATIDTWAIVSPNYDSFAPEIYRFSKQHGIPLNLSQGLLANTFAFFSEDMQAIEPLKEKYEDDQLIAQLRRYFQKRESSSEVYNDYRGQILSFIQRYEDAKAAVTVATSKDHFRESFRSFLMTLRLSANALGLDRQGLYYGIPQDLLGVRVTHLSIIGLQDHAYPPRIVPDSVLTDAERGELNASIEGGRLLHELATSAPRERDKDCLEKICLGVGKSLYLGFDTHDLSTGDLSLPSSFLNRVLAALGADQKAKTLRELALSRDEFLPRHEKSTFFDYDLLLGAKGTLGERAPILQSASLRLRDSTFNGEDEIKLTKTETDFTKQRFSSTSLTDFFTCPYLFYQKHILGLKEPDEMEDRGVDWLDYMEFGTFVHEVFREFVNESHKGGKDKKTWKNFLESKAKSLIEPILAKVSELPDFKKAKEGVPQTTIDRQIEDIRKIASSFIEHEKKQVDSTGFFPVEAEKEFEEIQIELGKGKSVLFGGIVDRFDQHENGSFRVVDYKTGKNRHRDETNLFVDGDDYTHFQHGVYSAWALQEKAYKVSESKLEAGYYFTTDTQNWAMVLQPYKDFNAHFIELLKVFHEALATKSFAKNSEACDGCSFQIVCGGAPNIRQHYVGVPAQIQTIQNTLHSGEVEE